MSLDVSHTFLSKFIFISWLTSLIFFQMYTVPKWNNSPVRITAVSNWNVIWMIYLYINSEIYGLIFLTTITQGCIDRMRALSYVNIDECQVSVLSLSLFALVILQVSNCKSLTRKLFENKCGVLFIKIVLYRHVSVFFLSFVAIRSISGTSDISYPLYPLEKDKPNSCCSKIWAMNSRPKHFRCVPTPNLVFISIKFCNISVIYMSCHASVQCFHVYFYPFLSWKPKWTILITCPSYSVCTFVWLSVWNYFNILMSSQKYSFNIRQT